MATKTSSKATTTKKTTKKRGNVKVTPSAVTFTLNAAQQRAAKKCLAETGRIKLSFNEVSVTKLGGLANAIVIVN